MDDKSQANLFEDSNNALWLTMISILLGLFLKKNLVGEDAEAYYKALEPLTPDEQFNYVYDRLQKMHIFPPGYGIKQLRGYIRVMKAHFTCFYFPEEIYPVQVTLFCSKNRINRENHKFYSDSTKLATLVSKCLTGNDILEPSFYPQSMSELDLGWSSFSTKPVDIYEIPGDHVSMITEPNVGVLAEKLIACIEKNTGVA
ncbi:MAG: hypothetical protein F6K23_24240 [Okeania sp. SIO2C9]|uniref:thioesterase domain-containing protein n=1 Tax=Okeania sp. SIO2C9 TaxID=2607791 RepID=UPI0013C29D36|nr:hypothetical protein [Okeania sp. SIO2C9]NEQ75871.1 hypothetical protein [Okeania sp. SIO2C9]